MARVRTREEALLNAYLNRYQNVQASTVNSGSSAAQSAQSKGSALMNSTDKTLPEVKDYSADVYNGIIKSADRDQNLTVTAAKAYQKEQEEAAKAAEKAVAKSRRSSGKSSSKSSGKAADSDSDTTDVSAAVNELLGGTAKDKPQSNTTKKKVTDANSGATAQAERNASARKKYDGSEQEKSDKKYRQEQKNQKIQRTLNEKQNGNPGKTGNSYAERRAAAQGTQSRAVTSAGKQVGSSYAAAGQAPTEREIAAGQQVKKQTADTLQKLQTDNDYLAELAKPGRKLTQSEINAVKQYGRNANDLYKEYQDGKISVSEYNQQAQDLARLNQKASLNGLGQGMQAFTSGLMTSVPFLKQADKAVKSLGGDAYSKAIEDGVIPDTLETLQGYQDQNKLAAAAGTMAGKSAQYATFNNLMAGTHLADTMGKVGGKVMGAASKIPGLERFATPAAGEALGRILTDQTADTALDTIPSLVNDLAAYDEQQGRIKNGEQVDNALTPGQIGLNVLGNVGQNFAMNALPEIGGAVVNGIKNSRTAQRMLDEQAQALADGTLQNDAAMLLRSNDLTPTKNLPIDNAGRQAQNEVTGGIANGTTDLGGTVPANIPVLSDGGKRLEPQPGENGIEVSGTAGAGREAAEAAGNGARAAADGAADSTDVGSWASAITGKDRRSALTRRVEDLGQRIASGENRDTLLRDANDIAARIVKESDFAEQTDHAATVLRDYMKNTPIRLDEQTAGELLYTSGLKNLGQYNIQNGTNFSTKKGLDFDVAMQELNGMNVGLSGGDGVDALLDAVAKSKSKPAVDEVYASAYTEYVRDTLLDGTQKGGLSDEGFSDWLEVQGFNEDAPVYVRQMYERQNGYNPWRGTDYNQNVLNRAEDVPTENPGALGLERQTAESVSAEVPAVNREAMPLNGSESVPENAVGAENTQYDRREVLNQDYANQRVMSGDMSKEEAAQLGIGQQTHTVYSRAEGHDVAMQDFDLLTQQTGSVTKAARTVADELTQAVNADKWDAENVYKGYYAAEQLQHRLSELPPDSAEAALVKAQIQRINGAVSVGQSKAGQSLVSGRWAQPDEYTALRKLDQYNQGAVDRFSRTANGRRLNEVAQDVADTFAGPMDDEFTAFVREQGIDTGDDVRDQMEYLAGQIQRMGQTHHVDINEEQARAAAASVQAGGTIEDIFSAFARQSLGIENLSQEDFDYAVNAFSRIRDMPDSKERYKLEMSVYNRMANYMPARGFADRLNNIRYLCMLGNSRTHIRNILGNVMMGTVVRAKDNVAGVMQLALPQSERTKAIGTTLTADGRQMVQRAREYAESNMYSTLFQDGRWNMDTGLAAARDTFTTRPGRAIERLSDINGNLLEAEDNYFLRSEFGNSMASFLKARGYDSSIFDATDTHSRSVIQQAAAQALEDAREATFHEENFLSTAFKNLSNDVRQHGPAGTLAHAVIEGILPFKKTPINIAKNALEYNAIGGTVEAIYRGATGQGAARVMDAAAKGITGSAIMGAGYLLAKNGMLTGGASGDDRADAYKDMTGEQNYAVKVPGKGTYTLDWASPASVPLLIGAEIANDNTDLTVGQILDKARQLSQPVLETTMLQGLNDTLDSISYADSNDKLATLGMSALGSYANQFVPTALGQIARTADDTRRSTYGGGDTKTERDVGYNLNKMESKIPGLSRNLEPYVDQWGREEASLDGTGNTAGGTLLRGLYNMGSPGYLSQENVTPVDEYLQVLYGETNDSKVLPEKASSKLTLDKETYYMTPQEKTEYAKTSGKTAYDIVDSLRQNEMFLQLPEEQQAELVQDAYTVAKTAGGVAAVGDGVSGVDSKEYQAYEDGGTDGLVNYMLAKNAVDVAKGDADSISKTDKWEAVSGTLSGDAAASAYVAQSGKDSVERRVYDAAGESGLTAYMNAYSSISAGLEEGKEPSQKQMTAALLKAGLNDTDLAKTYFSVYSKDEKGAAMYSKYGTSGLKSWLAYITVADADGNGSINQTEAKNALNAMDLTEELKRAYWQNTNKSWKANNNPY
jgi:hypothetical protein